MDIKFSNYNDDILYVLTNKAFIKKWRDNETKTIGRKNVSDFGSSSEFKWFTTVNKNLSSDFIQIYTHNSTANANQILIYTLENVNFIRYLIIF